MIVELITRLENWYNTVEKAVIAFSGGVDSCLVAYLSRFYLGKENVIAVISNSASLKSRDLEIARKFCSLYDIHLEEIDAREIEDPNYQINPTNRCYFCKTALYSMLEELIAKRFPDHTMLNGTNFSDHGDYRPGLEAASEHRVRSPLSDCKLEKADVRTLAKHFNLFTWDKPASPCLSSRFPYGEAITLRKLRMVEDAENLLNDYGFDDIRVRHIGNQAKIEVPTHMLDKLKKNYEEIERQILELGFESCSMDEEGLVSGKLNREIINVG
jgi:uncharacterized protein